MSQLPIESVREARLSLRRSARLLKRNASEVPAHLARLMAAMVLPGSEPVQGVMADLFVAFGEHQSTVKLDALELVRTRLAAHVACWFESQIHASALPRITPLATRWSVLAIPSVDISTRARRCSVDDSRALAAQVVSDIAQGGLQEQQLFLHHCVTCHDNLAFMLARRALLKMNAELPPGWDVVSDQLEKAMESATS